MMQLNGEVHLLFLQFFSSIYCGQLSKVDIKQDTEYCRGVDANQKINLILEALKNEFNPLRVFLFGSRVNGNANSESDFDFVVVVKETNKTRIENMRRARSLAREVAGVSADVFVYDQKEFDEYKDELSSVPESAINTGRELDLG